MSRSSTSADVLVVGDGIIGLSIALEIARRGLGVVVFGERLPGAASFAAPGLLAPDIGSHPPAARSFMRASLDMFSEYASALDLETGLGVGHVRDGVLELFRDENPLSPATVPANAEVVSREWLLSFDPSLGHASGALLYRNAGTVNTRALLEALDVAVARRENVRRVHGKVEAVGLTPGARVRLAGSTWYSGSAVVLAAGAWTPGLAGLPRALPIAPVRGQVLAVAAPGHRYPVIGGGGYLVPRGELLVVGSTEEHAGFDASTTDEGIALLRRALATLSPSDAGASERGRWAGLRPMTPDKLPMIGVEPESNALVYACGHSRNGILLAPLTARAIADLVVEGDTRFDLSVCSPARFS